MMPVVRNNKNLNSIHLSALSWFEKHEIMAISLFFYSLKKTEIMVICLLFYGLKKSEIELLLFKKQQSC